MTLASANASHGWSTCWPANIEASSDTVMFSDERVVLTITYVATPATMNTTPQMMTIRPAVRAFMTFSLPDPLRPRLTKAQAPGP